MPNFLENIFSQLKRADGRVVLREIRGEQFVSLTGGEMLEQVHRVRGYLRRSGLQPGDRCALLAANSVRWLRLTSRSWLKAPSWCALFAPGACRARCHDEGLPDRVPFRG